MEFLKEKTLSEKVYLGCALLAVVSLFLPWVEIGFASASGFQQQGYLLLVLFAYPVITILADKNRNKIVALVLSLLNVAFVIAFISSKSASLFGTTVNASGTGLYLMLIATIGAAVAGVLEFKQRA